MKKLLGTLTLALCALPLVSHAQAPAPAFPTKPVTIVVPYSPGGGSDNASRATSRFLSDLWHQPVIVENLTGADGLIGARKVIKSAPDGHTLLVSIPAIAILKYTNKSLEKDPLTELVPVTMMATGPTAIVVKGGTDIKTIDDLKRKCATKAANCSWASGEPFTLLAGSGLMGGMGIADMMTNVRYAGTSAAVNDIIGGHVTALVTGTSSVLQHHKAGTLKILAVSTDKRIAELPDVPTYAQVSLGAVEFTNNWYGIFAPAGTPPAIQTAIADAYRKAAQDPEVLKVLTPLLLTPVGNAPAEFAKVLERDQKTVEKLSGKLVVD
ncbi:MAG: tripartite tricarboxylate transporter substrate binding protein [Burkholderiales bacterium]